jgi:hypothetical protein
MNTLQRSLLAQARVNFWDHGKPVPPILFARMEMAHLDPGTRQAKALDC